MYCLRLFADEHDRTLVLLRPYNRRLERKARRVPKLEPGKSHDVAIDFRIHSGKDAVQRQVEQIDATRGGRKTVIDAQPVKVE